MFSNNNSSRRPLPLKQRTSSLDKRRDYSHSTWWSLLVLLKVREFFVTVDNFSIWRRHLAWAMESGKDLRSYMMSRYGSSMVFMSLLLSTELGILFNSAPVTTKVREALREGHHETISFWAGFMIIISALFTLLGLIATFTAWGMVSSINEVNAHCIFRSSIGQYAAELPGRLIVCSIYFFLISFVMFFFLLMPVGQWSITLLCLTTFLFVHVVSVFSSFGRIIMHSGAMGDTRIFTPEFEDFLVPYTLHSNLLIKAQANLSNNTSIIRQYRRKQQPIDRHLTAETMYDHLSGNNTTEMGAMIPNTSMPHRPRADSTVRFADEEQGNSTTGSAAFNHNRSLTPLSDTSFRSSASDRSALLGDDNRQLLQPPTPTYSSLRKSSFGGPPRPPSSSSNQYRMPPTPPPPPSGGFTVPTSSGSTSALDSVSSISLEQWLQSTPSPTTPHGGGGGSTINRPSSATAGNLGNNNKTNNNISKPGTPISYPSPPSLGAVPSPTSTSGNAATTTTTPPNNKKTHEHEKLLISQLSSVSSSDRLLTPVHSEISFDHRDLSEDERFALDYGDFEEVETTQFAEEYRVHSPSLSSSRQNQNTNRLPAYGQVASGTTGVENLTQEEEERRGLLDRSNPNHFYGNSSTSRRSKSPPPPPPPS